MPPTARSLLKLPLPQTVYLLLVALADGPAHGYKIRADVLARSNGTLRLDPGSLYRTISRLLDDELVEETEVGSEPDGDARRRTYRLTAQGRRVLLAETQRLADLVAHVQRGTVRRRPRPV